MSPENELSLELIKIVVENCTDFAKKWVEEVYKLKSQKVKSNAWGNVIVLLDVLADRIDNLENQSQEMKKKFGEKLDSPDVSNLIEQAIQAASITKDLEKKEILANLIIHRLEVEEESTESLILRAACEKVHDMNSSQIKVLGILITIEELEDHWHPYFGKENLPSMEEVKNYLISRFRIYKKLNYRELDTNYLESINCCKVTSIQTFLTSKIIPFFVRADNGDDLSGFFDSKSGQSVLKLWVTLGLEYVSLTQVGILIGQHMNDVLANSKSKI